MDSTESVIDSYLKMPPELPQEPWHRRYWGAGHSSLRAIAASRHPPRILKSSAVPDRPAIPGFST